MSFLYLKSQSFNGHSIGAAKGNDTVLLIINVRAGGGEGMVAPTCFKIVENQNQVKILSGSPSKSF